MVGGTINPAALAAAKELSMIANRTAEVMRRERAQIEMADAKTDAPGITREHHEILEAVRLLTGRINDLDTKARQLEADKHSLTLHAREDAARAWRMGWAWGWFTGLAAAGVIALLVRGLT